MNNAARNNAKRRQIDPPAEGNCCRPIVAPDAEGTSWSWTWSSELRDGRVVCGFHRHFTLWQENPDLYESRTQPTRGWARIRGNKIELGCYPSDPVPDWPAVAELVAKRAGLCEFTVHLLAGPLPESLP